MIKKRRPQKRSNAFLNFKLRRVADNFFKNNGKNFLKKIIEAHNIVGIGENNIIGAGRNAALCHKQRKVD